MRTVHDRMRAVLRVTRDAVGVGGPNQQVMTDLLLFCHGFCAALTGHHQGEDRVLFPAIRAAHPELEDTLHHLQQDHLMIADLVARLEQAIGLAASPAELGRHLDGIEAIMESHFGYEERQLLAVLERLELDADPTDALGPL